MSEFVNFPKGFVWGTATAAYQIEGAASEDGRKASIWDVFSDIPGKVDNGDTGDTADDHYHRWREDIQLMKDLGYQAYRFSLAWPRILPDGKGKVNQAGIDFYSRLIDGLLEAGIHPLVTLYHWDLPAALPGGWLTRDSAAAFAEFSGVAARAFGDRVIEWVTINEPYCASFLSYKYGIHAPGMRDTRSALIAAHHLLLAHGMAIPALRQECAGARVGIVLNEGPFHPLTQSAADLKAARHGDGELNRWFLDPLYGRYYPADMLLDYFDSGVISSLEPEFIQSGDMEKIAVPTDFLGLNYYSRTVVHKGVKQDKAAALLNSQFGKKSAKTDIGWEVYPDGLYETLCRVYFDYKPAEIIITENGAAFFDGPDETGRVRDIRRIDYLRSHLTAANRAIQAGVPLSGYYCWSLLDNFEWSFGYAQRFGLIYVDYTTLKRTVKDSARWYAQVVRDNGLEAG
ncbi:MAG: GH1 family beta-glucosidase [Anaerolineaceae bacterium]